MNKVYKNSNGSSSSCCSFEEYKKLRDIKYFLMLSERMTGVSRKKIKVIDYEQDKDGLYSGLIEIDGVKEYIHEYI